MHNALRPIAVHRGAAANFAIDAILAAQDFTIDVYVDDAAGSATIGEVPVVTFATWREDMRDIPSAVTALDPAERAGLVERLLAAGGRLAPIEIRGSAVSRNTTFGDGTLVDVGALFVGNLITVGRHAIVMTPVSLGHDIVIGNFVTIFPSAAVSGHVVIDDNVTIGVGAVITNGRADRPLHIGRGAQIATGAVVMSSVPPGVRVAGNPARPVSE